MQDTNATGNYYTIGHVTLFTGLSDRTIRNYISSGILRGEKINGVWHFTPEQVDTFVRHPAVRPSILAKKNGLVYDFLLAGGGKKDGACLILDSPGRDRGRLTEFFCTAISEGDYRDIHYSFDGVAAVPRVFLRGDTGEVLRLVNAYYAAEW